MKTIIPICCLLFFSFAAYSQSVVGTWTASVPVDDAGNTMALKFVMNADNTYTYDEGNDGQVESNNTYAIEGNKIHFDVKNDNCSGKAVCEFEMKDENTLWLKPVRMDCGDGTTPPPFTLTRQ